MCILYQLEPLSAISRYPMCVLLYNLMLVVQSINFAYTDFWSPYLVQMGAEIRQSVVDIHTDSLLSQNWPPYTSVRYRS